MTNNTICAAHCRPAIWEQDEAVLRGIRAEVFIRGQNVPEALEWEGDDHLHQHIIAEIDGQAVGTGRISSVGKIGRMAVLSEYRGQHIGAAILQALVQIGSDAGLDRVYLYAQCHAQSFYSRQGFQPFGEVFDEAGIAHIAMQRDL